MLALLLACASEPADAPTGPRRDPPEEVPREDTAVESLEHPLGFDTGATVTEEEAPPFPEDPSAWIFSLDRIHEVALTIPDASEAALQASPYTWAPADFSLDGVELGQVGIRLRGKIGSFRALSGKPKFKVSFDQYVDGQTFYGLEELSLNNAVVDCSYLKEVVGMRMYAAAGIPHLRMAYASVTVNGSPYGLYVLVETPDDEWLARHYEAPDGNLYDGKYVWYGGYSYTLLDFGAGVDELFQLEEGTDVGNADIAAISTALLSAQGTADFYATMGALVDWNEFHRVTAVDHILGHNDGYSMNTNNYRVYFDPTDGKADLLPWDLDYTFLYDYQWGLSWAAPNGNLTYACWQDATCVEAHRAAVADVLAAYETVDWTAFQDELEALTYDATQTDPRRECAATDVQPNRDYVREWLARRPAELRAYWGL